MRLKIKNRIFVDVNNYLKKNFEKKTTHRTILILILIYGFFLRILNLDKLSMWIDETISASAANGILQHGYPLLEQGVTYWRAYIFHYLMSFFILVIGGDFGARFVSVLFGVLTIYLAYLFGKKFLKTEFSGLAFALLIAVSSWEIMYSSQARFYQMFQFFYFLSFYLFYKFVILKESFFSKKMLDYLSLIIVIFITINTHFFGYVLIPLFFVIFLIHNFSSKTFKKWWFWVLFLLSILVGIYILMKMIPNIDWIRFDLYSSAYFNIYFKEIVLLIFALAGATILFFKDYKFNLSFLLVSLIPLIGLFFIKYFGTRYAYFVIFALFFYVVALFKEVKGKQLLFIIFLIMFSSSLFNFTGAVVKDYDASMPLADYKGAYNYLKKNPDLLQYSLVTSWSPANAWYGVKPDYQLNYSLSGDGYGFWREYGGGERFTGAKVVNSLEELPSEFVLVLDFQAKRKIKGFNFDFCVEEFNSYNVRVLNCKNNK